MLENVGHAVGNQSLEGKGRAQHSSDAVEEVAANIEGFVTGAYDQAAGAMKGAYNSPTRNSGSEAVNKAQEKKGEAQKKWNK